MKKILFLLLVFAATNSFAQTYKPENINKKAIKLYEQAIEFLSDENFEQAIPVLEKAIATDTNYVDAILSLAAVYNRQKKYQQSITTYNSAKSKDSNYFKPHYFTYSLNHAGLGNFVDALQAINQYLSIPKLNVNAIKSANYRKKSYEFAINYSNTHNTSNYIFNPINLGDSINTNYDEYYPNVSVDDSLLIFNRNIGNVESFMESRMENGKYKMANLIAGDINIEPRKGAITMSADGECMIFAGDFGKLKGFGNFDLYISYLTPNGWSEPQNLGANVNTEFWESSPSLSADKQVLYFSSNRYNGVGGKDLYYCILQSNGRFGPAINMGDSINTKEDDYAPFIHVDNETLYFTSNGWQGYGGADLFVSRKTDTGWKTPENLGYPINTLEQEGYLAVSANGKTAYYSSNRSDGKGGLDLYRFDLPDYVRPSRTLYVKGKVYDKKTLKPLPSTIELIDNATANAVTKIETNELGEYLVTLPTNKDYTFSVNKKGYLFYTELFELKTKSADSVYKKDIALQPVALNATVILKNIQFQTNSYKLLPISLIELDKLLQILNDNPSIKIEVNGHTDNIGKAADNLSLSSNRARSVVDYLMSKGIAAKRLAYKGFGSTKPIADNKTEKGRALNRRTEFKIIAM